MPLLRHPPVVSWILALGLGLSLFPLGSHAEDQPTTTGQQLQISRIENTPGSLMVSQILKMAYRRIGYTISFQDYSGRKAVFQANSGVTDGETMRVGGLEAKFPNLVAIPTPVLTLKTRAYTISVTREIGTIEDIKDLRLGVVRGIIMMEELTKGLSPLKSSTAKVMFRQLEEDKIDIALAGDITGGLELLRSFPDSDIHAIGEPLSSTYLHHYLHKRNENLVSQVDKVLRDMKESGEMDRVYSILFSKLSKTFK